MSTLLDIKNLSVSAAEDNVRIPILSDIDLAIEPGQTIGVVGESGSGKTVLVRSILGLTEYPLAVDSGEIAFQGVDLASLAEKNIEKIRGRDIALTTAEPRKHLNPLISIGAQLINVICAHRDIARKDAIAIAVDLLNSVGIPDPELRLTGYPHEMSGGMCQRIVIAMALAHETKILLVDEPTAGLDVTISRQILDLIQGLIKERDLAVLLVSRDLGVVAHYCDLVAVMYAGQIVEKAKIAPFFSNPIHPYSKQLLRSAAAARDHNVADQRITSLLPPATVGCAYAPRCQYSEPGCEQALVDLTVRDDGHLVRCLRQDDISRGLVSV